MVFAGDLSGNDALFHDISVNKLWIGGADIVGSMPGTVITLPSTTTTLATTEITDAVETKADANATKLTAISYSDGTTSVSSHLTVGSSKYI